MDNNLLSLIGISFIGSVAGLLGGIILILKKKWANNLASVSVPLAAGVLLALSLLDLLPEAVETYGNGSFMIILGVFVVLFLIERFFFFFHHHTENESEHFDHSHENGRSGATLVILGDTIHNFLDGVVLGATFLVNPSLALLVSFSTFLHETPHEVADFGILLNKGWSRKQTLLANFLSSLATFPGAILTYLYADKIESGVGILLAIAAGFFLYVATTDFLPEATHAPKKLVVRQAVFLLIGVAIIIFIQKAFPELSH